MLALILVIRCTLGKTEPAVYETIGKSFKYVEREALIKHSVGMADVAVASTRVSMVHQRFKMVKCLLKGTW